MKKTIDLVVSPKQAADEAELKNIILNSLAVTENELSGFRIIKRSIDARSPSIKINLRLDIFLSEPVTAVTIPPFYFHEVKEKRAVTIIGAGPAGLFAALRLIELGIKPVIIERGKTVKDRRRDLAALNKEHIVNPDSNYCFGEGGAGTYSDGKLYTRSTKRGDVQKVLSLLVQHGASEEILVEAHPHIGTNKLPKIIEGIRATILQYGGEIFFETRLKDILFDETKSAGAGNYKNDIRGILVESIKDNSVTAIQTDTVILATGHSARDIFEMLNSKNILIEAKPFAMGVRVEHPQELIDGIQYHCYTKGEIEEKRKYLPPAPYSLVQQVNDRGVYSFCMCPGGIIAPCATAQNEIVVNGWSPSKRNNPFANSGVVVGIELSDLSQRGYPDSNIKGRDFSSGNSASFNAGSRKADPAKTYPLSGLRYQQSLEQIAWEAGGKTQTAPAQRLEDFVKGKFSSTLPVTSYQPGIKSAPLHELLPSAIGRRLQEGFKAFGRKMNGYLTNEAVVHGVESRTSSPVRIPRDKETYEHPQVKGLYPIGEGAGYAGGIMSAAIDGQHCAEKIALKLGLIPNKI